MGILPEVSEEISTAQLFTIMAHECTDVSNEEQVVTYIQWVDADLQPHEEFFGLITVARPFKSKFYFEYFLFFYS